MFLRNCICLIFFITIFAGYGTDLLAGVVQTPLKSKILMILKKHDSFISVAKVIEKEIVPRAIVDTVISSSEITYDEFESKIKSAQPQLLIVFDNSLVDHVVAYNEKYPLAPVKTIALMGLNYKKLLQNNKNICGIAYEVPAYTLITQFRYLLEKPIKNALVFYRPSAFSDMISEATEKLKIENINLIGVNVEKKGVDEEKILSFMKSEGMELGLDKDVHDVIWIMLDSVLLDPMIFKEFWLPLAKKTTIPIIVGVENLLNPKFNFSVFGVTPNLYDMAIQAVQMVESILFEGEKIQDIGIEDLIGVNKFLNMSKTEKLELKIIEDRSIEVNKLRN